MGTGNGRGKGQGGRRVGWGQGTDEGKGRGRRAGRGSDGRPGCHLSEGDIGVREDTAEIVGKPAQPSHVPTPFHTNQAHCRRGRFKGQFVYHASCLARVTVIGNRRITQLLLVPWNHSWQPK